MEFPRIASVVFAASGPHFPSSCSRFPVPAPVAERAPPTENPPHRENIFIIAPLASLCFIGRGKFLRACRPPGIPNKQSHERGRRKRESSGPASAAEGQGFAYPFLGASGRGRAHGYGCDPWLASRPRPEGLSAAIAEERLAEHGPERSRQGRRNTVGFSACFINHYPQSPRHPA